MNGLPTKIAIVALGSLAASLIVGCASEEDEIAAPAVPNPAAVPASAAATPVAVTEEARDEAKKVFGSRCITCHGPQGEGDGPGAAKLDPKPQNYHNAEWQKTVTDEEIEKVIVYGGAAAGKSPQMVPNPDLAAKPAVVAALREKVREFGKQPASAPTASESKTEPE
ncbi:MAG: c-type cytochrome [Isosphaeraceae bacterium]